MNNADRSSFLISIGHTSNHELLQVELSELPHLFLSFSDLAQLTGFFKKLAQDVEHQNKQSIQLALALSVSVLEALPQSDKVQLSKIRYLKSQEEGAGTGSRYLFLQALMKELKKRKEQQQKRKEAFDAKGNLLLVLVDDLMELIVTKRKYTGLYFLQLLVEGPSVGIHVVAASSGAYRNLLKQLLQIHPAVQQQLQQQMPGIDFSFYQPLGAELIITPEYLYFFKHRRQAGYERYFPVADAVK